MFILLVLDGLVAGGASGGDDAAVVGGGSATGSALGGGEALAAPALLAMAAAVGSVGATRLEATGVGLVVALGGAAASTLGAPRLDSAA